MMAGNPSWWSMISSNSNMRSSQDHHQSSVFLQTCPSSLVAAHDQYHEEEEAAADIIHDHNHRSSNSTNNSLLSLNSNFSDIDDQQQQLPHSWSQLLVGGLANEEDKFGVSQFHHKKTENWEDQLFLNNSSIFRGVDQIKQENSQSSRLYGNATNGDDIHENNEHELIQIPWSQQQQATTMPILSSPRSSVTTSLGSNILDFSSNNEDHPRINTQIAEHSSNECHSTSTGGVSKKARVQSSPSQPPLKVRKEKLGDRITALHQLVSPFGKTDTASVLLEAIGYIRFLQGKIEALSSPYLCNPSTNMRHQQSDALKKDLQSTGLCLVPVSCTHHVGNDNGADYWAPAPGGGGF